MTSSCHAFADSPVTTSPFMASASAPATRGRRRKRHPIRVFSFEQMHAFAKAAGRYEAMVRVFTDTGMRLGEVLPLRRKDFEARP